VSNAFKNLLVSYDKMPSGTKEAEDMLDRLKDFAETFSDWQNLFFRSSPMGVFEKTVFFKMATLAKTFGEWLSVYKEAKRIDKVVEDCAIHQLRVLANSPSDASSWAKDKNALRISRWITIFNVSPINGQDEATALNNIILLMKRGKEKQNNSPKDLSSKKL